MTPTKRQEVIYRAVIVLQQQTPDTAIPIQQIADEAGVSWRTAQTHLQKLVKAGVLRRESGSNPAGIGWAYRYYYD